MKKKLLSVLLCLCMVMALLPTTALATHNHGTSGIAALSNDMAAGSYYLTGDVTLSSAWTPENDITLCLNGHTLTLQAGITVSVGRTLTITNCESIGKILRDTGFKIGSMFNVAGTLSLNDVTIDGNNVECTSVDAVALYVTGSVSMESGVIENCAKVSGENGVGHGSAVYVKSGTVTMNNCAIRNNNAKNYGGAVYVNSTGLSPTEGGTFTMNGGSLTNNKTTFDGADFGGGAIYNRWHVVLDNVSLTGNSSTRGGAIYNSSYGTLTITGGNISGNTATKLDGSNYYGNGIFHSSEQGSASVLNIGADADIADEIYLDSTDADKAVKIQSALTKSLNLVCKTPTEGRSIAEGSGYTLTTQDMALISVVNSGWYLKLDENENTIQLTATPANAYLPVQLTSSDAGHTVTLNKNTTTVTLTYDSSVGAYTGNVNPGTYQVLVDSADYKQTITVSGSGITTSLTTPVTEIAFPSAKEGYSPQSSQTVTVINTGNTATGELAVALGGTNASSFTLSGLSDGKISDISAESNSNTATFTVQPNTELAAGTYNAMINITGSASITPASIPVSFTVVSSVQDLESVTFSYAYDAQRNPTYPTKNQIVNMSGLAKPLDANGTKDTLNNSGSWTLSRVDTYSYVKDNVQAKAPLSGIVSAIARNYSISDSDTIVIHELKNGSAHIAYGVVIAYDAPGGRAVFLGDTWGGSGACYLLSTSAISETTASIYAGAVLTDYISSAIYGISLSAGGNALTSHTFTAATEGYATAPGALTVTVTNTGNQPTGDLTVTLSGTDAGSFTLNKTSITDIAFNNNDTFTVKPNTGLGAGIYTATVTVSGANIVSKSFNVSFTVSAAPAPSFGGSYTPPSYKVESEASKDDDGSVSVSKSNAKKGDTVTITVTPDRYYKVAGVTVKDKNGKEIAVTDNGDGTFTFKMPASKVTVEPAFSWDNPFGDVAKDTYYAPAVEWALKNDITNGTGDGTTFSPDADCTRAQMVTFLWHAAGSPEPTTNVCPYTDVDLDSYYGKAALWAVENGITKGTSVTIFSPDMECSRAQMAAFLCRMADGKPVSGSIGFTDVPADAYYAESVQWAAENSITEGTGAGKYSPNAVCTRGQIVTFLYRWMVK